MNEEARLDAVWRPTGVEEQFFAGPAVATRIGRVHLLLECHLVRVLFAAVGDIHLVPSFELIDRAEDLREVRFIPCV